MKVICLESSFLIEDSSIQTAVKGGVYTVIDAVKDPKPVITKRGNVKTFAKGWWYKFAETGNLWHHEFRFEKVVESVKKTVPTNQGPTGGPERIALPKKVEVRSSRVMEDVEVVPKKKGTKKNVGKLSKLK